MLNFILSFFLIFSAGIQGSLQKTLNKKNPKHLEKHVNDFVVLTYQGQFYFLSGQQTCEFFAQLAYELPIVKVKVHKNKKNKSFNPLHVSPDRYQYYIYLELRNEYGGIDKVRIYVMVYNGKIVKIRL